MAALMGGAVRPGGPNSRGATLNLTTSEQLKEALGRIAEQAATIRRLQQAVSAAERRAELAEESVRRAYRGFAASAGRR
jgi:hypothetical protein